MINFYFFPFTFMDIRQAQVLCCFFDRINVLDIHGGAALPEPMADLAAKGTIARIGLDKDDLSLAAHKVRNYQDWATIHKGNERNFRTLIRENVFFKDDSSVAAIRTGIRNRTVPGSPDAAIAPDSSESLVFLKLADIHDRQTQDIQAALDTLDQENAALFAELKGDEETLLSTAHTQSPEPGRAMTEKRIKAWLKAAADAGCFDQDAVPVLITTSRAVMDELLNGAGNRINALDIDSIKVHEKDREFIKQRHLRLESIMEQMAQGLTPDFEQDYLDGAGQCPMTGRIQIRFFPGLGDMILTKKNPGGQLGVCLVELNS